MPFRWKRRAFRESNRTGMAPEPTAAAFAVAVRSRSLSTPPCPSQAIALVHALRASLSYRCPSPPNSVGTPSGSHPMTGHYLQGSVAPGLRFAGSRRDRG